MGGKTQSRHPPAFRLGSGRNRHGCARGPEFFCELSAPYLDRPKVLTEGLRVGRQRLAIPEFEPAHRPRALPLRPPARHWPGFRLLPSLLGRASPGRTSRFRFGINPVRKLPSEIDA